MSNEADSLPRCFGSGKPVYAQYHDEEWGIPVHDDQLLFEMLILEGAQAGLSWETVLNKREGYRKQFYEFDIERVAEMSDSELLQARENNQIVRNRLKIESTRKNARVFLEMQRQFGSFSKWLWEHTGGQPIINQWKHFEEVPARTELSDKISKALKKRGMSFVGSTIIYAYLQAVGVVDDHLASCWKRKKI